MTVLAYSSALLVSILISSVVARIKQPGRIAGIFVLISVLSFFLGLRKYVGNDYEGYVNLFNHMLQGGAVRLEPGFRFLYYLLLGFEKGFVPVLFFCSLLILVFLVAAFERRKILATGIFFFFVSDFLFLVNDQVRQGVAIAIFLYSIKFIEQKRFFPFLILLVLAAVGFHYTAFICLVAYFVPRFKLPWLFWSAAIVGAYALYLSGFFVKIFPSIIDYIPHYAQVYGSKSRFFIPEERGTGLAIAFWVLNGVFVARYQDRVGSIPLVNLYLAGVVLYVATLDYLLANRVVAYFYYAKVLVLPLLAANLTKSRLERTLIRPFWLVLFFVYFLALIVGGFGKHGGFPYDSWVFDLF